MIQDPRQMSDAELLAAIGQAPAQQQPARPAQGVQGMSDDALLAALGQQRQAPRQTPRQAPAQAPAQMPSDPIGTGYTEATAITGSDTPEMMRAKLRAGRVPEAEINAIIAQYEADLAGGGAQDFPVDQAVVVEEAGQVIGGPNATPGYNLAREQELAKAEAMPGYADVGFTDQATAPLNDELAFAIGYAQQGLANFGRGLFGGQNDVSALDRARAMYDIARENQAQYEQDRPVSSFLGQALGGFALAPTRVAGVGQAFASRGAERAYGSAFRRPSRDLAFMQAAGAGGAYGLAEGNSVQERLGQGVLGSGAAVATAGLLDAGVGAVANRLNRQAGPTLTGPERRLSQTLGRLARSDQFSTADDLIGAIPEGGLPLDVDTPYMQAVVEAAAQTPGPARQTIQQTATNRRAEAANRFRSGIEENLGGSGNYFATLDQSIQARRQAADQGIRAIEGRRVSLNQNAVESLRSDLAQQEIRRIAQLSLGSPDPVVRDNGAALNRLADTLLDNPAAADLDLRSAQELSRRLLTASDDAWRGGDGFRGQILGDIGRSVRESAAEAVPAYRQWLRQYGDDSENIQALELGRRALQNLNDPRPDGTSAEALRRQFGELSDVGKDMFRKGIGEALVAQARATGDFQTMRRILRSDEMADRIKVAFPDEQAYTRFLNGIEAEVAMANRDTRIINGSPTEFRQEVRRMMGGTASEDVANRSLANTSLSGLAMEGVRQAARPIAQGIDRSRSVLQNPQSNEALGRALTDADYLRMLLQSSLTRRPGLFGGYAPAGVAAATQNRLSPVQ